MAQPKDPRIVKPTDAATQRVRVGANADSYMRAVADIRRRVQGMAEGKVDPNQLRRELLRKYSRGLMTAAGPGRSSVRGHKWATVVHRIGGEWVQLDWEWLPGPDRRPMVLGFCPECWRLAPQGVKAANATKPLFVESQLARAVGDREADAKFVPFRIESSTHHMEMDDRNRLTIREPVHCPDKRRCSWSVRITDGIAERISRALVRPGSRRAKGPLILSRKP